MQKKGINNKHGSSNFIYEMYKDTPFLIIVDLDIFGEGKSVTNDVHNVIQSLADEGYNLHELKVIYQDTQATFDAILINEDNTFKSFVSLNELNPILAMDKYDKTIKDQKFIAIQ